MRLLVAALLVVTVARFASSHPLLDMTEASVPSIVCPDGSSQCPNGYTCCMQSSGQWGCCPLANAVCCSDGVHCCPNGYTCDVAAGTCTQADSVIPMFLKQPALEAAPENVICADGKSECPDGNTCCKLSSGQYGCCPLPSAVCCSDGLHCCPNDYTCDTTAGTCSKADSVIPMFLKQPAMEAAPENVHCSDGKSECPDGNTCCKLTSGQYGCCPLPSAVCCSDGLHCCPNGYTCDTTAGTCAKADSVIPMFLKQPALNPQIVICPDEKSYCDKGICCVMKSNETEYGCCPFDKGVCCEDKIHCCPETFKCDTKDAKQCVKGTESFSFYELLAVGTEPENVDCPDGRSECPDGDTCCKLTSGQYGCCPLPNAVCCSDGEHCCPNGYSCSSSGTCMRESALHILVQQLQQPKDNRLI